MEEMHTPSPWEFDTPDYAHVTSEDYHVIRAGCGFFDKAKEQRKPGFSIAGHMTTADARLIAAAPEMLHILVETYYRLADIHNEWPGRNSLAGQKRLCDMRDCIAKALGMEPKDVYEGKAMQMGLAP